MVGEDFILNIPGGHDDHLWNTAKRNKSRAALYGGGVLYGGMGGQKTLNNECHHLLDSAECWRVEREEC